MLPHKYHINNAVQVILKHRTFMLPYLITLLLGMIPRLVGSYHDCACGRVMEGKKGRRSKAKGGGRKGWHDCFASSRICCSLSCA